MFQQHPKKKNEFQQQLNSAEDIAKQEDPSTLLQVTSGQSSSADVAGEKPKTPASAVAEGAGSQEPDLPPAKKAKTGPQSPPEQKPAPPPTGDHGPGAQVKFIHGVKKCPEVLVASGTAHIAPAGGEAPNLLVQVTESSAPTAGGTTSRNDVYLLFQDVRRKSEAVSTQPISSKGKKWAKAALAYPGGGHKAQVTALGSLRAWEILFENHANGEYDFDLMGGDSGGAWGTGPYQRSICRGRPLHSAMGFEVFDPTADEREKLNPRPFDRFLPLDKGAAEPKPQKEFAGLKLCGPNKHVKCRNSWAQCMIVSGEGCL